MGLSIKALNMNMNLNPTYDVAPHVNQHYIFSADHDRHQMSFSATNLQHFKLQESGCSTKKWVSVLKPIISDWNPGLPCLGKRWPEYQGARDWAGLLDPLDEVLQAEILRYGDFNEAAYRGFEFDPASPSYGSCKYSKRTMLNDAGFPNSGYRLTRYLRATSGIQIPKWAGAARSSSMAMQSSWIGYVAVCQNKAEIARLGRRDVVIALRGTATPLEWLENFRATLTPIPGAELSDADQAPMVETGFLSLYTSGSASLRDSIREEISRILRRYPNEPLSITLTGHSLGAALATLAAYDIKTKFERTPLVTVISFGGPRVGNRSFRSLVEKQGVKILRIVNPSDLITKLPGIVIDNDDDSDSNNNSILNSNHNSDNPTRGLRFRFGFGSKFKFEFGFWPDWIQKRVEDTQTQWAYAEVGCELRLKCFERKYEMNLAKSHDLKTYLQLVKDLSSRCPLRARARAGKLLRRRKNTLAAPT